MTPQGFERIFVKTLLFMFSLYCFVLRRVLRMMCVSLSLFVFVWSYNKALFPVPLFFFLIKCPEPRSTFWGAGNTMLLAPMIRTVKVAELYLLWAIRAHHLWALLWGVCVRDEPITLMSLRSLRCSSMQEKDGSHGTVIGCEVMESSKGHRAHWAGACCSQTSQTHEQLFMEWKAEHATFKILSTDNCDNM